MKANAEPVPLPPVAIDAELSLSFAVRLRGGLCTRFRPNSFHSVAPAQQSHRGPRRSDSVAPARHSQADGAISVGYARRHTDAFGYVVLANELSLVIAPIRRAARRPYRARGGTWRSGRMRPLPGVASVAFRD